MFYIFNLNKKTEFYLITTTIPTTFTPQLLPAKSVYAKSNQAWNYVGKIALVSRYLLNALASSCRFIANCPDTAKKIKDLTTQMKLLSLASFFFSAPDLKTSSQKIAVNLENRDKEELALNSLSFTIITLDVFDSITTFINSSLTIASKPTVALFSMLGKPVGFSMTSLGIVSRTVQIWKSYRMHRDIKKMLSTPQEGLKLALHEFLKKNLGLTQSDKELLLKLSKTHGKKESRAEMKRLLERKKEAVLRAAPPEVLDELRQLFSMVKNQANTPLTEAETQLIGKSLDKVKGLLTKKMKVSALGILANLFILAALLYFTYSLHSVKPYLLLAASFLLRLGNSLYQDFG